MKNSKAIRVRKFPLYNILFLFSVHEKKWSPLVESTVQFRGICHDLFYLWYTHANTPDQQLRRCIVGQKFQKIPANIRYINQELWNIRSELNQNNIGENFKWLAKSIIIDFLVTRNYWIIAHWVIWTIVHRWERHCLGLSILLTMKGEERENLSF